MKKAWNVIIVIVFIAVLLGAIAIGVGYLTGADMEQVYTTLADSPPAYFIQNMINYCTQAYEYTQQFIAELPARFPALFG
ncbi:MAG: hypothetical protein IKI69_08975 [Oscillospiraceae bacterium]|nr:hypothetical protein [Oscillospiraceae bacterium]